MKFKKITKRDVIDNVANRWKQQYCHDGVWTGLYSGTYTRKVYNSLMILPNHATEQQVSDITGSKSWTRITCDCCRKDVEAVVSMPLPCFDNGDAHLCLDCLNKANQAMEDEK